MRPNIDIPWHEHGRVKEYSEHGDFTLQDAYLDVIRAGLDSVGSSGPDGGLRQSVTTTEFPRVQFLPRSDSTPHFKFCTFKRFSVQGTVAFRSDERYLPLTEVESLLADLQSFVGLDADDGSFTVQQSNAAWSGRGLVPFFDTLGNQQERYASLPSDFDLQTHHSEVALYIANAGGKPSAVTITAQPAVDEDSVRHICVTIITNGIPTDPKAIERFGHRNGLFMNDGQLRNPVQIRSRQSLVDIPIQPVRRITKRDSSNTWVTGLIIENPFYQDPELLAELFSDISNSNRDIDILFDCVTGYRHIPLELGQHHFIEKEPDYRIRILEIDDLDGAGARAFQSLNLTLIGEWGYENQSKQNKLS